MNCLVCGQKNPKTARYCIRCGTAVPVETVAAPGRQGRRMPWVAVTLGAAALLVCLLLVVAVVLLLEEDGQEVAVQGSATPDVSTASAQPAGISTPLAEEQPTLEPGMAPAATIEAATALPEATVAPPTPLPTLPPAPTMTPTGPATTTRAAAATPTSTPAPTGTPTAKAIAKPKCRKAAQGLIGFRRQKRCDVKTGNACGPVEIWAMNGDGSGQALMCNPEAYDWALLRDQTSPDGEWRVEVTSQRRADIRRVWIKTGQQEMLIVNNGQDWDPVLSADGWWLAWVSNRNANDEVFLKSMDPADQNQRRMTVNDWEWDKHPTWSPDGRRIAFYSNRASTLSEATRQIWLMEVVNDQGVNLRNLSNRPDMVDTDPVSFKWDGIP